MTGTQPDRVKSTRMSGPHTGKFTLLRISFALSVAAVKRAFSSSSVISANRL